MCGMFMIHIYIDHIYFRVTPGLPVKITIRLLVQDSGQAVIYKADIANIINNSKYSVYNRYK